jgi:hypothetical protein
MTHKDIRKATSEQAPMLDRSSSGRANGMRTVRSGAPHESLA